jgi:Uma2 family endonuclease
MVISTKTYEQVALEDGDEKWELAHGVLRKKPPVTFHHADAIGRLDRRLQLQLDEDLYVVRVDQARLRNSLNSYYIPDLCVVPDEYVGRGFAQDPRLEVYSDPMPLVVEAWSPSTGDFVVMTKLPEYRQRGDAEIWLIHPYEKTLTAWRRQPDGSYTETLIREGTVEPVALPGVRIELKSLFRDYTRTRLSNREAQPDAV